MEATNPELHDDVERAAEELAQIIVLAIEERAGKRRSPRRSREVDTSKHTSHGTEQEETRRRKDERQGSRSSPE